MFCTHKVGSSCMTTMFLLLPYSYLLSFFLFVRTLIIACAPNWLTAWLAIELNLLSFIPLLLSTKALQELESATKYFFSQSLGRILILLGSFYILPLSKTLIIRGLLLKLGIAPFHFWFPAAIRGASWEICILITTWQKLPLLCLLTACLSETFFPLLISATLSVLLGGIIGLNQTQLRTLLAYSSISHTGWILALFSISTPAGWTYFFIYTLITLSTIIIFNYLNSSFFWGPAFLSFLPFLLLLSLGGLPPLRGFAIKLGAISLLRALSFPITLLFILGSLISLYYYLTLAFSFLFHTFSSPRSFKLTPPFSTSLISAISLLSFSVLGNLFLIFCALILFNES